MLWTLDQTVRVRLTAWVTVLCSWARHFNFIVHLSTQVYKWVPTKKNCCGGGGGGGGGREPCDGLASHPEQVENTPNRYKHANINQDKVLWYGPLGLMQNYFIK